MMLCLAGCGIKNAPESQEAGKEPRAAVTLTHGVYGRIEQTVTFQATTMYLSKSQVAAPVSGFVAEAYARIGTRVKAGQDLYRLESKERCAVGGDGDDGVIFIKSSCDGVVLDAPQLVGNYVPEGTALCEIAETESLVFGIYVPYEQRSLVRTGGKCTLELPDGTRLSATVSLPLATVESDSQSECMIASADAGFLPEGLNVKALFVTGGSVAGQGLIFPKSAVQSDESLTEYWVMRLAEDSTAVKVPVKLVASDSANAEVLSDGLSPLDNVILTGGYGLEEGAKVVVKEDDYE